jgi:hypothetical protein
VDPRAGVDDVKKRKFLILPGLELRPLGRPAHTHSLYRLRYPGFRDILHMLEKSIADLVLTVAFTYKIQRLN